MMRQIRRGDLFWLSLPPPSAPPLVPAVLAATVSSPVSGGQPPDHAADPAHRSESPSHAHPHVVVQDDVFNASRVATVIVCALTSNLHRATEPGNVLLDPGEGGLPKQSVVVVSQIDSVPKTSLLAAHRIGALAPARVDQILDGLRFQQASFRS